jgi:ABC-2 type transport system permease protein
MRETAVIMRRELRSYFLSPIAYVFGVLFLGVLLYFAATDMLVHRKSARMDAFFGLLPWMFLVFMPALTMRLWAEERKLGTLELLLTFPVTATQLILGKFLAALGYLAIVLLLTLGLPITLGMYGELQWGPVIAAYLAALLMAAAYLSIGMFFSSITRDQIIALLLAVVALALLYLLGRPAFLIQLGKWLPGPVVAFLGAISPYRYFESIARGVIDTRDVVYYAAFCGFFLHLNALVLRARRQNG